MFDEYYCIEERLERERENTTFYFHDWWIH